MACMQEFLLVLGAILLISLGGGGGGGGPVSVSADAVVSGSVYCDQCKDGQLGLFDFPLFGAKVAVACPGTDRTRTAAYKEESTNWVGGYSMRFDGNPDLSQCYARVVGGPSGGCGAAVGPAQRLNLMFNMFGTEMYSVDPLLSQPDQPMAMCPGASSAPAPGRPVLPPPSVPPMLPPPAAGNSQPPVNPFSSMEASACSFEKWMMPEFRCYWKVVGPGTKVSLAFGPVAAGRYGTDMTLWEGLGGRGDVYRTLLREGTTALLNSYSGLQYLYPTLGVVSHMNLALLGSPQHALGTALRFRRANAGVSGSATVPCKFTTCS